MTTGGAPAAADDGTAPAEPDRTTLGVGLVALATVGFGLNPLLARYAFAAGVPADITTLARYAVPAVLVAPWMGWWWGAPRRLLLAGFGAGLATGVGTVAYFRALDALPVPTVAAVYYTFPVFTLAVGSLLFGVRVRRLDVGAAVAAVAGSTLVIGPAGIEPGAVPLLAATVAAPIGWALLLLTIAVVLPPVPLLPQVGMIATGASAAVVPFIVLGGIGWEPTADGATWLLVLGVLGVLVPGTMVTAGAPLAGPTATGLIGSAELLVVVASSWLLLGEALPPVGIAGAALLAAGAAVGALPQRAGRRGAAR